MNEQILHDILVLYVEDEAAPREEILYLLKKRVREVLVAENGREGLELFKRYLPDLVITDIKMPVMDGLVMAEKIKNLSHDTQILITTALNDTYSMMEAIEIGVDQYVLKPVVTGRLFTAIAKCAEIIELRRSEKKHQAERDQLIVDLQAAMAKVKQLKGFLPICASCKKIRDDTGYWQQIEAYIGDRAEVKFSHGICPDCVKTLYPEFSKQLGNVEE